MGGVRLARRGKEKADEGQGLKRRSATIPGKAGGAGHSCLWTSEKGTWKADRSCTKDFLGEVAPAAPPWHYCTGFLPQLLSPPGGLF